VRAVIDDYLKAIWNPHQAPKHDVDNLAMAMSLVAFPRSVARLPAYAQDFLPCSVIRRPLGVPTIDLVVGYNKANTSPILKLFLNIWMT
jgi:LysR family hca operon transcriptional activator